MEKLLKKPVSEFMTRHVVAVKADESIKKVFKLMDEHGILGLPVVSDDNAVIGIVTESDLISHFTTLKTPRGINILGSLVYLDNLQDFNESLKDHCAELVKDVMTSDVVTIMHDATLHDAINLMADKEMGRLPVIGKKGELVGILTRTDIVHEIAKLKNI
jgi:CBS domain-containing protein